MYFSFAKLNNRTFLSVLLQLLRIIKSESVEYINGALVIYNLTISSKDDATKLSAYSNQSAVAFINPSLIPMTPEVLQHFNQTVKLACQDGFLPEFHILPQYKVALFHSCQTIGITIDPAVSYKLKEFAITGSNITALPKNLKLLTKLTNLHFGKTLIEHIDMDELTGLLHLNELKLYGNRIITLKSFTNSPIHMPKLEAFDVRNNQLSQLSFTSWNATLIGWMELGGNRLQTVLLLPDSFPKLRRIDLKDNPLDCHWKSAMIRAMREREVQFLENSSCI